ncbi:hypothetical protein RCL1_005357 [Eukaryota sp. TZLM3-RCL]
MNSDTYLDSQTDFILAIKRSLTLPRTCLRKVLFFLFQTSAKRLTFDNKVEHFCKCLSTYGTISRAFNSVLIDSLKDILSLNELVFAVPTHDSLRNFLMELFPDFKLSVRVLRLHYPRLDCFRVRALHFSQYHNQSISLFEIEQFLADCNVSPVTEFHSGTDFDATMLDLMLSNLPRLVTLNVGFCLQNSPYSFSNSTRGLRSLTITSVRSTLKISRVTKLVYLNCESASRITGLSCLSKLKNIVFDDVKSCDGLHPLTRLEHFRLSKLSSDVLSVLLVNELNFQTCNIVIVNCQIDFIISHGIAAQVKDLSLEFAPRGRHLSRWRFPMHQHDFHLNSYTLPLHFPSINHLTLANPQDITFSSTIAFPHLSSLKCHSINDDNVYEILSRSKFLHFLDLKGNEKDPDELDCSPRETASSQRIYNSIALDHLVTLSVEVIADFFSMLSGCVMLKKLSAVRVDFDFTVINSKFPNLVDLTLTNCKLKGELTVTNVSLKCLEIVLSDREKLKFTSTPIPLNFINFEGVEKFYLDLDCFLQVGQLVFPPFISTFHCNAPLNAIEPAMSNLSRLISVTGVLYCKTKEDFTRELNFLPASSNVELRLRVEPKSLKLR